jgi:hypothetical protein
VSSPTQRALKECKALGWEAQVVEKWVPQARRRVDLFGCVDIVALGHVAHARDGHEGWVLLGIQVTSASNHAARRAKALAEPRIKHWLQAGCRFEVWSYGKKGGKGKRKLWTLRIEQLNLTDFET